MRPDLDVESEAWTAWLQRQVEQMRLTTHLWMVQSVR